MINNYMQNVLRDRQLMIDKMRNQQFINNIQIPEPITMQGLLNEQVLENTNNTPEIIQEEAPVDVKAAESRKYPYHIHNTLAFGGSLLDSMMGGLLPDDLYNIPGTETSQKVGNIAAWLPFLGGAYKYGLKGLGKLGSLALQYGRKAI